MQRAGSPHYSRLFLSVVICLLHIQITQAQNAKGSAFQHPRLVLPERRREGSNEIDSMPKTRQPALQDPPPLAGTCALASIASRMLGTFYHRCCPTAAVFLPNSSPKQRPPPALRVGARLFSPPRTAVTNRRDYKQMGPQPFRPWRH